MGPVSPLHTNRETVEEEASPPPQRLLASFGARGRGEGALGIEATGRVVVAAGPDFLCLSEGILAGKVWAIQDPIHLLIEVVTCPPHTRLAEKGITTENTTLRHFVYMCII